MGNIHEMSARKANMCPFAKSASQLQKEFLAAGIPTELPGFYDHPNFMAIEQTKPDFLNYYAAYVAKQQYSSEYLKSAESKIDTIVDLVHASLVRNGRLGACVDISSALSRILEKEGIWNCVIKGSITITFPKSSNISPLSFWSVDCRPIAAGHAWVFAPPYRIIDISIKQQPYEEDELSYLPDNVLAKEGIVDKTNAADVIHPEARQQLKVRGVPNNKQLQHAYPSISTIPLSLPTLVVESVTGTYIKYCPLSSSASDKPLEGITNIQLDQQTPLEFYDSTIRPALK